MAAEFKTKESGNVAEYDLNRNLEYLLVDPQNQTMLDTASEMEIKGFGNETDPSEPVEGLKFIAKYGSIWIQYDNSEGQSTPTGIFEVLPLQSIVENLDELTSEVPETSPLRIIGENHERIFQTPRKFADDSDISYAHGIAVTSKEKGYGTALLRHALANSKDLGRYSIGLIDAAMYDSEKRIVPAENKKSFSIHSKQGFTVRDIIKPPVCDDNIFYYLFIRNNQKPIKTGITTEKVVFGEDASATLKRVEDLLTQGYVGTEYNRKNNTMTFTRIEK